MYYNYIRMVKDLYSVMDKVEEVYHPTLRIMVDECVMHFLQAHSVPFERQSEFLQTMFYDLPQVVNDYKNKKFDMK